MTNEARDRFLADLCARGLLADEEAKTARRLLAEAAAAGQSVSLSEILIRAGAAAAKAHHEAAVFEGQDPGSGAGGGATLAASDSSGLELIHRIGRGSQAIVYQCRQVEMDRIVAVKILDPRSAGEAAARDRFLREARAAAVLTHPNIVTIHEIRPLHNTISIVMEYVDGGTLADLLKVRKRFDPAEAVAIVRQVAEGLGAAHARGIIHRDVKPRNIMLTSEGLVKLADMGLARHVAEADAPDGKACGTPYYISPEQVTGDPPPDHRTDLYSLGVTFYEMVAGRPPFMADSPRKVMRMHVLRTRPDPRDIVPDLPQTLCWFLAKAMAREPEDRYQSAEAFIEALDRLDLWVEPEEGPRALVEQLATVADEERRRGDRIGLLTRAAARREPRTRRPGRGKTDRDARDGASAEPGPAKRKKPSPAIVALAGGLGVVGLAAVVLLVLYGLGVFDAGPEPSRATATGRDVSPEVLSRQERNAQAALASAARLEKTPGARKADVLQAYRNVITFYGGTQAAGDAELALAGLEAAQAYPPTEPPEPAPDPQPPPPKPEPPRPKPKPRQPAVIEVRASKDVVIHGSNAKYEVASDRDNIGNWNRTDTWVSWDVEVPRLGTYQVEVTYAAQRQCKGNRYRVSVGDASLEATVESTGDWGRFETKRLGTVEVREAGTQWLTVEPLGRIRGGGLMNLQAVRLVEQP